MRLLEDIGAYNGVQIGLHVLEHQIDVLVVFGLVHVKELHDVLVPLAPARARDGLEVDNLSPCPLRVGRVLEGVEDLLQRDRLARGQLRRLPHDPICTLAQLLRHLVALEHVLVDVF